jgi:hypothetical protein
VRGGVSNWPSKCADENSSRLAKAFLLVAASSGSTNRPSLAGSAGISRSKVGESELSPSKRCFWVFSLSVYYLS